MIHISVSVCHRCRRLLLDIRYVFFAGDEQREKLQELRKETQIAVEKVIEDIEKREEQIRPKQE